MDIDWHLATVAQVVFLLVVYGYCKPAIDFVIERLKRIKRKRQRIQNHAGLVLLVCVTLCLMSKC